MELGDLGIADPPAVAARVPPVALAVALPAVLEELGVERVKRGERSRLLLRDRVASGPEHGLPAHVDAREPVEVGGDELAVDVSPPVGDLALRPLLVLGFGSAGRLGGGVEAAARLVRPDRWGRHEGERRGALGRSGLREQRLGLCPDDRGLADRRVGDRCLGDGRLGDGRLGDRSLGTGNSATGISATGVSATGDSATGISATGVSATGGSATGVSASGASTIGGSAIGGSATGVPAIGVWPIGVSTIGVSATGASPTLASGSVSGDGSSSSTRSGAPALGNAASGTADRRSVSGRSTFGRAGGGAAAAAIWARPHSGQRRACDGMTASQCRQIPWAFFAAIAGRATKPPVVEKLPLM